MNLHLETLSDTTQAALRRLENFEPAQNFYLAGGTALALTLGHRTSNDLDFFNPEIFSEDRLVQQLTEVGKFKLEKKSEQTVIGILDETKISFMRYQYPLLAPPQKINHLFMAGATDLACMKLDTLASRGAKRDFVDVYFAAQEIAPLEDILKKFRKKYAAVDYNLAHVKKSLVYFADAEGDPMPQMLKPASWEEIKSFFRQEILKLQT